MYYRKLCTSYVKKKERGSARAYSTRQSKQGYRREQEQGRGEERDKQAKEEKWKEAKNLQRV